MRPYELRLSVPQNIPSHRSKALFYWSPDQLGVDYCHAQQEEGGPQARDRGPSTAT